MVRKRSNPHHSWLGLTEQQNLTFDKGGKGVGGFRGIVRFFEESMSVQLYSYTHEIINALSVRKVFPAVLAICLTVRI